MRAGRGVASPPAASRPVIRRSAELLPDGVDAWPVRREAAAIDPPHSQVRVDDHVATELAGILRRHPEPPAPSDRGEQPRPVSRVEEGAPAGAPPEPEGVVGNAIRIAEHRHSEVEGPLEDRHRRRGGKRHADHASGQAGPLRSDLHEVLIAGHSTEVAHEDEHHGLAAVFGQVDSPAVGGRQFEIRDLVADVHSVTLASADVAGNGIRRLRNEHGRAADVAAGEACQRRVGGVERMRLDGGLHAGRDRDIEKLLGVGAGEVRDAPDCALTP